MDDNMLNNDLSTTPKTPENTDIQIKLYSWFEEKGIINKLRAHIREQMISALKDTPSWKVNKTNVSSPKIQAINLLIADFLMNQDNLFTLSVFITEVPFLGNLSEFSSYVNNLSGNNVLSKPITKPSFQINDVQDILEALGVQPNSDVCELTCQYYINHKNNHVHSLLVCLFKAITTIRNNYSKCNGIETDKNPTKIESDTYEHRLNSWLVSVEDILSSFNLNEEQRNSLKRLLKRYHLNNNTQEATVYRENLKKLEKQNKEMVEKVAEVEQMLTTHSHDTNFLLQKKQIEYATQQLCLEQHQLYQLINIVEEKEKSIQEKLRKSEEEHNKKLQDIENRKSELRLKEMEILRHQKMLNEEPMKHTGEIIQSNLIKQLQEQNVDLAKQLQEIKSKLDELEACKTNEPTSLKNNNNNFQKNDSSMDREMMRNLQKENEELRTFIKVQQQRIEELSNKASNLARQIEKTHLKPPTKIGHHSVNVKKKLHFVDNSNKKSCHSNQNLSSTTTDHSTTVLESDNQTEDDMIQEARSRLKMLEINTAKVEQNLKNFQNRIRHNVHKTDYNTVLSNRRSYNEIQSNLSEDSDFGVVVNNNNKINLKELANKIGYHRSIKRSLKSSLSENDTSPEIVRSNKFHNYSYVTNTIPIENSSVDLFEKLPLNKPNLKIDSPIIRTTNHHSESLPNMIIKSTKENQLQHESTIVNRILPDTDSKELNQVQNHTQSEMIPSTSFEMKFNKSSSQPKKPDSDDRFDENINDVGVQPINNSIEKVDSPQKSTIVQQDSFNRINSLISNKEQESDNTISFGSYKTDRSSDFWT